jgi:hypothetical protein
MPGQSHSPSTRASASSLRSSHQSAGRDFGSNDQRIAQLRDPTSQSTEPTKLGRGAPTTGLSAGHWDVTIKDQETRSQVLAAGQDEDALMGVIYEALGRPTHIAFSYDSPHASARRDESITGVNVHYGETYELLPSVHEDHFKRIPGQREVDADFDGSTGSQQWFIQDGHGGDDVSEAEKEQCTTVAWATIGILGFVVTGGGSGLALFSFIANVDNLTVDQKGRTVLTKLAERLGIDPEVVEGAKVCIELVSFTQGHMEIFNNPAASREEVTDLILLLIEDANSVYIEQGKQEKEGQS